MHEIAISKAKGNLRQHFSIVGVTERFDETLILLKRTFGWADELLYYPKNVTPQRPLSASLPQSTIDAIKEANELDFQLYEFAKDMLDEAIASEGPSFSDELEKFKDLNNQSSAPGQTTSLTRVFGKPTPGGAATLDPTKFLVSPLSQ